MTFKDYKELLSMDNKALQKELEAGHDFKNKTEFQHSQALLKDTSQLKKARGYIAWIETIMAARKRETASITS